MEKAAVRNSQCKQPPKGIISKERGPLDGTLGGKHTHSGDFKKAAGGKELETTIEIKGLEAVKQ